MSCNSFPFWRSLVFATAVLTSLTACDLGTLPPGVSPADAIKLRHVCADSFQFTNRLIRADGPGFGLDVRAAWPYPIIRGGGSLLMQVHVPWAKSASEPGTLTIRIPSTPGMTVQVSAVPTTDGQSVLLIPPVTALNDGPAVCAAPVVAKVRIRNYLGLGVTNNIPLASDSIPMGTIFRWNFSPTDGATSVDVRINNKSVEVSGVQTISGDLMITAVGLYPHHVSPEVAPLVDEMRALLTSSTPHQSVEKLLNDLVAMLDRVDEATGDSLLDEFRSLSLTTDAEVDNVLRLDSLLANTVLHVQIPGQENMRAPSLAFPSEPTTYFVAAGILTTQEKVAATARVVRSLIHNRDMLSENDLVRSFVSPSMTGLNQDTRRCIARIFSFSGIRERVNGFMTSCLPIYGGLLDSNDFIEATSQILKQWVGGVPSRQTSLAFMDSLQRYRDQGFHVLTDAHSQGTLISREAITEMSLRGTYQPARDTTCLGVVAMAGPVSGNWPMPLAYFREFATEGDIVAASGGSTALRIPTDLTRQRDSALASISKLNLPLRLAVNLMYGLRLHDLQNVYLGEAPPRDYMLSSNDQIRRECETAEIRSALGDKISISPGEEFPIGLYFAAYNYNGHPLPSAGRRLVSLQPSIAEMLDNTTVVGRSLGTTSVVATKGNRSGKVIVEVHLPPLLGIGGTYTGQWRITQPTVTGQLTVSIGEMGSVTKEGLPQISGTVSYSHPSGNFTVQIQDGKVSLGGVYKTITFRIPTPEFSNPDSWAEVSLEIQGNGVLSGGETLYFQGGLVRETRAWDLSGGPK